MSKPANLLKPPLLVEHATLTRSGTSIYRSECPVCRKGTLLVRRDENGELAPHDNCIGCGQRFVYTDIERMRERERILFSKT